MLHLQIADILDARLINRINTRAQLEHSLRCSPVQMFD